MLRADNFPLFAAFFFLLLALSFPVKAHPANYGGAFSCTPTGEGKMDCYDKGKGGAPAVKVEPNQFGGVDYRYPNGKVVRCEKTPAGMTECRKIQ